MRHEIKILQNMQKNKEIKLVLGDFHVFIGYNHQNLCYCLQSLITFSRSILRSGILSKSSFMWELNFPCDGLRNITHYVANREFLSISLHHCNVQYSLTY